MLPEAAGLAFLASLSPTALLIVAVYLGSARPRLTSFFYLMGAVAMSVAMAVVLVVILRSAELSLPTEYTERYSFRVGLGVLLLLAGAVVATRRPKGDEAASSRPGRLARMTAQPGVWSAFLVGVVVFAPGATFIAAVQVIATAKAGIELTTVAVIIVVVLNVLLVWLPIGLHVLAPEQTTRYLTVFNGWLRRHSRAIAAYVLLVIGAIVLGNGIYGLVIK